MNHRDRVKLLFAPYHAPSLHKGDRTHCLARDCDVIITSWTAARIPWPRCRAFGTHGGGSGLLVDEEFARAIRSESATAIKYWWGVVDRTVWWFRKALGVGRADPPGSKRLIQAAAQAGAESLKYHGLTDEQCDAAAQRSKDPLLGTKADDEVAGKIGRTVEAVRQRREELGIANPAYRNPPWTPEQLALLGTMADEDVAKHVGRTQNAVRQRREKLGIARCAEANVSRPVFRVSYT